MEEGCIVLDAIVAGQVPEGHFAELTEDGPSSKGEDEGQEYRQVVSFPERPVDCERANVIPIPRSVHGMKVDLHGDERHVQIFRRQLTEIHGWQERSGRGMATSCHRAEVDRRHG